MNSIARRQVHVDIFPHVEGFRFEHQGQDCALPSIDKVHAFFQEKCFDTVRLCQGGKKSYVHFGEDEIFYTKKELRKTLSHESGGAWIEEKDGKKRYFVDDSGWFQTSYKQVSKEEFLQRVDSPFTLQKVLGIGLGILALLPGALEIKEWLPLGASQAGLGLLALQQKSPLLGALGFSLLPSSAIAQAVGTEFQVNNYTTSSQGYPAIASLNDGGFVIAWESNGQDGNSYSIFAQRYDDAGALLGSEFQVNNDTTNDQAQPVIAPLNDGGFVVAWESSNGQDGDAYGVFAQRYNSNETLFSSKFQVNNYTTSSQSNPAIVPLNDGGFVVAWHSNGQDGDAFGIFAQRHDASGATMGSEFQVNNYTTSSQAYPVAAPLSAGGFVIAWTSFGQDGSNNGIFAQRYDNAGAILGSEFQVNSYPTDDQDSPAIAPLDNGGFVVAWESYHQDGDYDGIFAQRYGATGARSGSEFKVNNYTTNYQNSPAIAPLNDGGFVVAWESVGQDGDGRGIFAQRYDVSGALFGSEFQVNSYTTSNQQSPVLAPLNDGGFVVAWMSDGQDGDSWGIFGQRFDQSGNPIPLAYVPSTGSTSALGSNAATTSFPSSQLSLTSSPTTGNSTESSSTISTTSSSSRGASQTTASTPSNQVVSLATTILPPSSTSGMQSTSLSDSSSPSGFQIPTLIDVVYGDSYSITQNGQTIGTFTISGGSGLYSSSNPNTLEIQLAPNYELQEGDIVTLFSVPQGEAIQWEGITLSNEECFSAEGVFVENQGAEENSYQVIFNLDEDNCSIYAGATKLSAISVLTGGGLI